MPDIDNNVIVDTTGNTASIATDFSSSGVTNAHVQIVKLAWGGSTTNTRVTTADPLPVNIRTVTPSSIGITGTVGGLGNFRVLNGLSGSSTIPLIVSGTTSTSYTPVQVGGNIQGVTNGVLLGVTGTIFVGRTINIQGFTNGIEVGITGGRRLNSTTDSVTVAGTIGVTGGRYLMQGTDTIRIYGANSGETMIPVTLRDGSGSSIGSSGGALNVNIVGAGITATVSINPIVGICQADQSTPFFVAGATAGPAVRVKGTNAGDAVGVVWSSALPVSVSGPVIVDLDAINTKLVGMQTQLTDLQTKANNISTISTKLTTGINTTSVKPGTIYHGTVNISSPNSLLVAVSTGLYSGITIRAATSNGSKDVLLSGITDNGSSGYPLPAGQSIFIETNNLQNILLSSNGGYPITVHYIAS